MGTDAALEVVKSGKPSVITVYAPWCQFCQAMEDEYSAFASEMEGTMDVFKFRGDEVREFVEAELNTKSFPTINVVKADGSVVKYESEDRGLPPLRLSLRAKCKNALETEK